MAEIPKAGSISFEDRATKELPYEWGFGSTPRTAKLRDGLYWKAAVVKDWVSVALGLGKCTFRRGVRVDMDRARLVTQSYKETTEQPSATRAAKAVKKLCEEMPIFIKSGELIVGDPNGAPDEARWYPEICSYYMPDAVTSGGFSEMVTDDERKGIVEDICEYWKDKSLDARIKAVIPDDVMPYIEASMTSANSANLWEMGVVVLGYDYEALFREGLQARIDRAEAKLKELDGKVMEMNPAEYVERRINWQAMAMCGKAIIHYSERHAELAREQAKAEKDEMRRRELEEMAAILDWVPANPPRTFHECLQFYWIIETVGHFLAVSGNGCGIRFDQVWWPYYEADMKGGRITREKALELVECLFLKIQEVGSPLEWPVTFTPKSGGDVFYTADICGSTPDGRDASNDLSCIIMEALADLRVTQPPIALRYHRNISPEVVERAIDLERAGLGHPSWFNEELLEKWGLMRGWSPEDARNTQAAGCVANVVKGKFIDSTGIVGIGAMLTPKVLEEVLFEGGAPAKADEMSKPSTKDPREMTSSDELLDAICERMLFYTKVSAVSWNIAHEVIMQCNPDPCNSLLMDESLNRGIDMKKLHKEDDTLPEVYPLGEVNTANSLAAIQKLVFDEKKYTIEELVKALKANWEGYEEMRQDFLNAPKYGNDDDYADEWAVKVKTRVNDTVGQVTDAWGYPFTIDGSTAAGYQMAGFGCGATPDGRLAMSYIADGSRSPMAGTDSVGPTAVLNSAGKIPFMHTELFNQRFMPVFLEGENRNLFAEYLREWYEKGTIPHIQFNVVDSEILREAQEHPESYTDLQVRVAGYSAFWIDLPKETQDSILARTEQCLA